MPKSCLLVLNKMMHLVDRFSPNPTSKLEVINALLEVVDKKCMFLYRDSFISYKKRLLNWQLADSVIDRAIRDLPKRKERNMWDTPPFYRLQTYYRQYCELAIKNQLKPISYSNFRRRVADFPSPYKMKCLTYKHLP